MSLIMVDPDLRVVGQVGEWRVEKKRMIGTEEAWVVIGAYDKFHHAFKAALSEDPPPTGESDDNRENRESEKESER